MMAEHFELPGDWESLVCRVAADAAGCRAVVLLDGGSGSGKTTLALRLRDALDARLPPGRPAVQLVSLDDAYPGWHGLAAASDWVWRTILRETDPGYPTWDWDLGRTAGWVGLDAAAPIIVEGCGALSRGSAPLATTRIWYEMPAARRKERALGRDGDGFRPWWDAWARQEARHWARNRPRTLADLVVTAAQS